MKNNKLGKIIRLLVICSFVIYVAVSIITNTYKSVDLKNQQEEVKQQLEVLNQEKQQIEQLKEQYSSDEYIEKIARERLGLVKPGEKLLIDITGN